VDCGQTCVVAGLVRCSWPLDIIIGVADFRLHHAWKCGQRQPWGHSLRGRDFESAAASQTRPRCTSQLSTCELAMRARRNATFGMLRCALRCPLRGWLSRAAWQVPACTSQTGCSLEPSNQRYDFRSYVPMRAGLQTEFRVDCHGLHVRCFVHRESCVICNCSVRCIKVTKLPSRDCWARWLKCGAYAADAAAHKQLWKDMFRAEAASL
jgi:hypothetical protein